MLQIKEFSEAAGLGFEPRLTDPESFSFRDTGGHEGTGGDKPALVSGSSSLRGTGRDRERHPVAVRLRSNLCSRNDLCSEDEHEQKRRGVLAKTARS